jgi:hypothetical protein
MDPPAGADVPQMHLHAAEEQHNPTREVVFLVAPRYSRILGGP